MSALTAQRPGRTAALPLQKLAKLGQLSGLMSSVLSPRPVLTVLLTLKENRSVLVRTAEQDVCLHLADDD